MSEVPTSQADRLDRIEAILRDHQLHEPDCPAREVQRRNNEGLMYYAPKPCTCWLSEGGSGE